MIVDTDTPFSPFWQKLDSFLQTCNDERSAESEDGDARIRLLISLHRVVYWIRRSQLSSHLIVGGCIYVAGKYHCLGHCLHSRYSLL